MRLSCAIDSLFSEVYREILRKGMAAAWLKLLINVYTVNEFYQFWSSAACVENPTLDVIKKTQLGPERRSRVRSRPPRYCHVSLALVLPKHCYDRVEDRKVLIQK